MDIIGKVASIFLAVILLFFAPLLLVEEKKDLMMESYVLARTGYLVEHIRSDGYLSPEMYRRFQKELEQTGMIYKVEMEHQKAVYYPEETNGTLIKHYQNTYENDILKMVLEEKKTYIMNRGDFFFMKVTSQNRSMAERMKSYFLIPSTDLPVIQVELGGVIRDEIS